mmetsp:Transcript_1387/g.1790  ORF Transcript_1387/g.1790 Transcript_1387/m.1790 type:complete len:103 (+) Transcript_1387:69-377(+)
MDLTVEDDDFFGNDNDSGEFGGLGAAESRAMSNRNYTIGFEAGIEKGEARSAQRGFDEGYEQAFISSFNSTKIKGIFIMLRASPHYLDCSDIDLMNVANGLL